MKLKNKRSYLPRLAFVLHAYHSEHPGSQQESMPVYSTEGQKSVASTVVDDFFLAPFPKKRFIF